jgi:hypothetical protein
LIFSGIPIVRRHFIIYMAIKILSAEALTFSARLAWMK